MTVKECCSETVEGDIIIHWYKTNWCSCETYLKSTRLEPCFDCKSTVLLLLHDKDIWKGNNFSMVSTSLLERFMKKEHHGVVVFILTIYTNKPLGGYAVNWETFNLRWYFSTIKCTWIFTIFWLHLCWCAQFQYSINHVGISQKFEGVLVLFLTWTVRWVNWVKSHRKVIRPTSMS